MPESWFELRCDLAKVAEVVPRLEGAPAELWAEHSDLAPCPPGELFFVDATISGHPTARSRCSKKGLPVAMTAQRHGGLLLERGFAQAWLREVPSAHASLRPVQIRDADGLVSDAHGLLEVHKVVPLDRDSSGCEFFDTTCPHGSFVARLGTPQWRADRQPPARMFRLLELPTAIFVDSSLLADLDTATRGAVAALGTRRREGGVLVPPPWTRTMLGPFDADPGHAARAADAFWALVRGETAPELRATALTNPWYAIAVAATLDGAPHDETRAAACVDPHCAVIYARLVDRGPHPATEAAARSHGLAAAAWATRVTGSLDDGIAGKMLEFQGAFDAATVSRMRNALAPVQMWRDIGRRPV